MDVGMAASGFDAARTGYADACLDRCRFLGELAPLLVLGHEHGDLVVEFKREGRSLIVACAS
jgi:hypothetical protein